MENINDARKVNGKLISVMSSVKQGNSHVSVVVQPLRENKETHVISEVGTAIEAFGGFKREEDFNYVVAEKLAIQNAVSHIKK